MLYEFIAGKLYSLHFNQLTLELREFFLKAVISKPRSLVPDPKTENALCVWMTFPG